MSEKKRLDAAVFDLGLAPSREKAKAFIMAGVVYVNNQKADKAGMTVTDDMNICYGAFNGCSSLVEIILPEETLDEVDDFSFAGCSSLCADPGWHP